MQPTPIRRFVPLALLAAALVLFSGPDAAAQSAADLRRENQSLKTQVAELKLQHDAALAKIRQLEAEINRLQALARGGDRSPSGGVAPISPEAPVTVDETDASASPRAILAAIRADYAEMAEVLGDAPAEGEEMSVAYRRTLDRWTRKINRSYRLPVQWHVRVVDRAVPVARGFVLRLQAVDPVTGTELGNPFDTRIGKALAARLQGMDARGRLDDVLILRGTANPVVRMNSDRSVPGAFDNPPLIAPYVEFQIGVEAQTLLPRPPEPAGDESARKPTREEKSAGDTGGR